MLNERQKQQVRAIDIWKGFFLLFIPLFGIALFVLLTFYFSRTTAAHHIILSGENERISLQQKNMASDLDSVVGDLRFLASDRHLQEITNADAGRFSELNTDLAQEYLKYSSAKKMYDQIRFLDISGMEVVRVNFNSGSPDIVAPSKLQNKKGRYYFDDTLALGSKEIFISPFDLNVEQGQIEKPLKPMIRFGMPVFDSQGEKTGIVLLNYFGEIMLRRFHDQDKFSEGVASLLNRYGYYLHNDDHEMEWGFMYTGQKKSITFGNEHPDAWSKIIIEDKGQFGNSEGLFTFATVYPLSIGFKTSTDNGSSLGKSSVLLEQKAYFWKLVSFVPNAVLYKENTSLKFLLEGGLLGFAVLIGFGSWKISAGRVLRRLAQARRDILLADLELAHQQLKESQSQLLQNEKMASVGQLAAGVAHEINNPMGFIAGNLRTLQKYADRLGNFITAQKAALSAGAGHDASELNALEKKLKIGYLLEDTQDLINESLDGAERVQVIVKNLKTFSRVDQNLTQTVDLHECLDSTINIVWNELKYKVELEKDYGDLPLITCQPQQLSQVFMNLLINGSHAIVEKGRMKIVTSADADSVYVAISDDGCGIEEDHLKRIFEPFFTTKEVGKGTGLGLSMVFDIIKSHHGEISVKSVPEEGTTFTIKLPIENETL